jgi:hypothetical protein
VIPKPPPPPPPPPPPDAAQVLRGLHESVQLGFDGLLRAPRWAGLALLALAVIVTVPGRHGQRPLNAALLGGGAAALALYALGDQGWLPGVVAIVASVLLALFGMAASRWGTAALVAGMAATAGALIARALHFLWLPVAAIFAGLGLYAGMVKYKRLALVLPPICAAIFAVVGAAIAWAPHWRGAHLGLLNDVDWTLGIAAGLAVPLVALSLARERRRQMRIEGRTRLMDDEELKTRLAQKKEDYRRAFDQKEAEQDEAPDETKY